MIYLVSLQAIMIIFNAILICWLISDFIKKDK